MIMNWRVMWFFRQISFMHLLLSREVDNSTITNKNWKWINQIFRTYIRWYLWANTTPSGPFWYFMVLIDESTRWFHICLLSSLNQTFTRLLAPLIWIRAHFPNYPVNKICVDMLLSFHFKHSTSIVCLLGLTLNILYHILMHKMGLQNHLSNV